MKPGIFKQSYRLTFVACLLITTGLVAIYLVSRAVISIPAIPGALIVRTVAKTTSKPVESEPPPSVTFIAVGDIMLSRTVADRIRKHQDVNYPFLDTADYLRSADFVFGNLEAPITPGRTIGSTEMVFRAEPGVEQALKAVGVAAVSLANNHIMNFGAKGLEDTIQYLDAAEIAHAGAGAGAEAAQAPALVERNGITVAFLAYSYTGTTWSASDDTRAGPAAISNETVADDVALARAAADIVVVSMHNGTEYAAQPSVAQKNFAHAAIDAGADLVIGHHPHVVQTVEKYLDKYILYSLGNFVFDQMWSEETRHGMTARITLDRTGVKDIRYEPIIIDDYAQPRLAEADEAGPIIERLHLDAPECDCVPAQQGGILN